MAHDPIDEKAVFNEARRIHSPGERAAYLQQACGHDADALRRIESLLRVYEEERSFLEHPAAAFGVTVDPPSIAEQPGKVIGPYKLIEQIGEGGMGTVWMAEQTEPVRRKVALKLIKPGMDSKQVLARFEAERHALALMDHPNIARVYDAGVAHDGRPYFVMELVKGVPITRYCDDRHLTPRQRLELFVPVCHAIQHAHQKGVIHRDIKPSNVLIALYDDRPVPKVIDFGVAKAAGQPLTEATLHTGFGAVVGTVEYMSPEQAGFNQLDVDTRSDIYSLGVLLYELLTGSPPFTKKDLETAGVLEMLRVIREQEPSKPSTKLSTADGLPTLAANRGTEPAKLTRLMRGELDWIVMKALEKDRGRRYETANSFAMDVQRYLADEPVQACPPSARYRFRKFARRNKSALFGASVLALAIIGGLTTLLVSYQRVTKEKREKEQALEKSRQETDRANRNVARAQKALDTYLLTTATDPRLRTADLTDLRKALLTSALSILEETVNQEGEELGTRAVIAWAHRKLGFVHQETGQAELAVADYERSQANWAGLAAEVPESVFYREELAESQNALGALLLDLGQLDKAEAALLQSFAGYQKLNADFPGKAEYQSSLGAGLNNQSHLQRKRGNRDAEQRLLEQAIVHQKAALAASPSNPQYREFLANHHNNLGVLWKEHGKLHESEAAGKEAHALYEGLATEFPKDTSYQEMLASSYVNRGNLLSRMRKPAEAEQAYRRAIAIRDKLVADYPSVPDYRFQLANTHHNLADDLLRLNDLAGAERSFRQAIGLLKKLAGEHPAVPEYRHRLAMSHHYLGELMWDRLRKLPESEPDFRAALRLRDALAKERPGVFDYAFFLGISQVRVGVVELTKGNLDDALVHLDKAVTTLEAIFDRGGGRPEFRFHVRSAHGARAEVLSRRDRYDDALKDWDRALELDAGPQRDYLRVQRALTLAHMKQRHTQATEEAEAIARLPKLPLYLRYTTACVFAVASATVGEPQLADRYAARAVELLREVHQQGDLDVDELKEDKKLNSLRARMDFKKLLADVEAKQKQ